MRIDLNKIIQQGGATFDTKGNIVQYNRGYMVSLFGHETVLNLDSRAKILNTLNEYLRKASVMHCNVGAWIDNNKIYIDLSENVADLDSAKFLGFAREQKAIFDCNTNEVIYLIG